MSLSGVAAILQQMAENAGRQQMYRGAVIGNTISQATQIPAQMIEDRRRQSVIDREQAQRDTSLRYAGNADARAQQDQDMQNEANVAAQKRRQVVNAGLAAAIGPDGDPKQFNGQAAFDTVSKLGDPSAITDVIKAHKELQAKPTILKEGEQGFDEYNKPITGMAVPKAQTLEQQRQSIGIKKQLGLQMTPEETAFLETYDQQHPKTRSGEDQALDAYAKSIGKTKAEDLTYPERQTFDKNKAAITSSAAFQQHVNERTYDNAHPAPVKAADQNKLEQEARTLLTRAVSSRSGGIGAEDAKVQQANHLISLMDQNYDPKTDTYNIPNVQQTELAMGLARLVSPGGTVAVKTVNDINQATAKGDLAKALTYITGTPFNGTTQDLIKMYHDSILRQGQTAEQNREGEMRYLRGLMPTELEESRRTAMEANTLNPLRQSRVATDAKGNRKLFVSLDGGKTWQ